MKKVVFLVMMIVSIFLFSACSSGEQLGSMESSDSAKMGDSSDTSNFSGEMDSGATEQESEETVDSSTEDGALTEETVQGNRKIIYTAYLNIEVKEYEQTAESIESKITEYGGYLVTSTMSEGATEEDVSGEMTVRIPQERFREFLEVVEKASTRVIESSISGEDVTEEYVDLESRLKAKRAVESRLLTLMEQAEKTEDLLAISKDLATVQEEIESVIGRMNYLQNRSDYATITIYIQEKNVTITNLGDKELNTWEETKEQFKKSINFLLNTFSAVFVLIVGNIPILILVGIIVLVTIFLIRKRKE